MAQQKLKELETQKENTENASAAIDIAFAIAVRGRIGRVRVRRHFHFEFARTSIISFARRQKLRRHRVSQRNCEIARINEKSVEGCAYRQIREELRSAALSPPIRLGMRVAVHSNSNSMAKRKFTASRTEFGRLSVTVHSALALKHCATHCELSVDNRSLRTKKVERDENPE